MKYKIILPLLLLTVCLLIVIKQKYHVWMPQSYMRTIFPQDQSVSSATESSTNTTLDIYSERRQHVSEMCDKYKHDIGMTVNMLDVTSYIALLCRTRVQGNVELQSGGILGEYDQQGRCIGQ